MKRVMSITAVLAAVTCHSAYGQLDGIGGAAQGAAGQIGSAADSAANQVQSQTGNIQTGAAANTQAGANVGASQNTGTGANLNTDANANTGISGVGGQADVNASSTNLNTTGQAGVNASTQNQVDRGLRNVNRGVNRGFGAMGGIVPQIPQQARTGNGGPYDARWRFTQQNGQWWYYSPQNQWMVRQNDEWQNYDDSYQPLAGGNVDQGAYRSGYRGDVSDQGQYSNQQQVQGQYGNSGQGQMQMTAHTGPVYTLRYDHGGREYICVHGQRVYFDDQSNRNMDRQSMGDDQSRDERYESGRQNLDATDPADERPLAEPQSDGEDAADTTATEPPPTPTADSPSSSSDAESTSDSADSEESAASAESEQSDADNSETRSESNDSEDDDQADDA